MDIEIKTWLQDIERLIDEIQSFLPDKRDFFEFKNDLKTKKEVKKLLE